jgi:ribonuclease T2
MRLLSIVVLAACHSQPAPPTAPAPAPSEFGLYLLAMTWAPQLCCDKPGLEDCATLAGSFAASHLTLHGLWPNYTDEQQRGKPRAWPQFCGAYQHCEAAEDASCAPAATVPAELAPLAPSYKGSLATHEWSKHGSCTTLSAAEYFAAELAAIRAIPHDATPEVLRAAIGSGVARDELERGFGIPPESVAIGCDAHCRLTQVGFCFAKDARDHPTTPIACTANITTSEYDNGCVTRGCARVNVPGAGACEAP